MRSAKATVPCALFLAAMACSTSGAPSTKPSPVVVHRSTATAALKVPPGHLPPVGECRVWRPGTPPGHQAPPRACAGIERHAPAGSWILYRPAKDRKVVHVRELDPYRPGLIVRVRVHDARHGTYLREADTGTDHVAADRPARGRRSGRP